MSNNNNNFAYNKNSFVGIRCPKGWRRVYRGNKREDDKYLAIEKGKFITYSGSECEDLIGGEIHPVLNFVIRKIKKK